MNITPEALWRLLPLLIVTGAVVLAMLAVAVRRSHALTAGIVAAGLAAAAAAAALMMGPEPTQATPLLIVDDHSLFFSALCCLAALAVSAQSFPYLRDLGGRREEYHLLLGMATIGALVMVAGNHFASALLGLETLSMSLYGMLAYPLHAERPAKHPLESAVKYLVLSAVATTFILFGMALAYAQTGSLGFAGLPSGADAGLAATSLLLIVAGVAFKLSLAPFHIWTPDVYEGAPAPAAAYLATVGKAAAAVLLLRLLRDAEALRIGSVTAVLSALAGASMLVGNLLALLQENVKRVLAYSSIAHMGYLLVAFVAAARAPGSAPVEAVTFYLVAYVVTSLGAFGVVSLASSSARELDAVSDYRGLFWRSPWTAAVFTAMLLSLAGIPLTAGFIGKFYLFYAGVETGLWALVAALVAGSGIGLYYYLRIVYQMTLPAAPEDGGAAAPAGAWAALGLALLLVLALGVWPAPLMSLVESLSARL